MRIGRLVGYALLGLVDALVPALAAAFVAWEIALRTPVPAVPAIAASALLAQAAGAVLGAVAAARGGKPFPLTRGVLRLDRWNPLSPSKKR